MTKTQKNYIVAFICNLELYLYITLMVTLLSQVTLLNMPAPGIKELLPGVLLVSFALYPLFLYFTKKSRKKTIIWTNIILFGPVILIIAYQLLTGSAF